MTSSLLYISCMSNLTKEEVLQLDRQAEQNRKELFLLLKELRSKSKRKLKRLGLYAVLGLNLGQPVLPYTSAVVLSHPISIYR